MSVTLVNQLNINTEV